MINAWFTPSAAHWFVYLSLFSLFSVLGHYTKQGRYRKAVTGATAAGAAIGAALFVLTVIAAIDGQPRYVLISLGIPGIVVTVVFLAVFVLLPREYATAELRRMTAKEI
jgi:hypothetical protein